MVELLKHHEQGFKHQMRRLETVFLAIALVFSAQSATAKTSATAETSAAAETGATAAVGAVSAAITTTQARRQSLGSFRKWDALKEKDKAFDMCYMISTPSRWTANRKGVSRGDIYFMVTSRPRFKISNQVNTIVGYPLKPGSTVSITIDGRSKFKLFTDGDAAWAYTPSDDKKLVAAMKAGGTMVVVGTSSRGTVTTDRYSLSGFTAANNAINRNCK